SKGAEVLAGACGCCWGADGGAAARVCAWIGPAMITAAAMALSMVAASIRATGRGKGRRIAKGSCCALICLFARREASGAGSGTERGQSAAGKVWQPVCHGHGGVVGGCQPPCVGMLVI